MAIRRLKQPEDVSGLEIIDITEDGRGIGKSEGRVLFIDKAVPGDIVNVTLHRRKKSLFEGRVNQLIQASSHRTDPDRKSVVEGKSVSVRVDSGGRRLIKKKKTRATE